MKQLIAIDGYSLMYRAHYALADMTTRNGEPTGALHGFCAMLLKLIERKPDYIVVAFDTHGATFRHERYADYKAGRKPMPEELRTQIPKIKELLSIMGIKICELAGYEADDILGTIAGLCEEQGIETLLVTGDRDVLQLITDRTQVLLTKRGITDTVLFDKAALNEKYGLTPAQMIDLKALMGDSSDNIPGVAGVGEKTAQKLITQYGSLEGVYSHMDEITGKLHERLKEHKAEAELSYWLGKIDNKTPLALKISDCLFDPQAMSKARPRLLELELRSIASKLPESEKIEAEKAQTERKLIEINELSELKLLVEQNAAAKAIAILISDRVFFAFNDEVGYLLTSGETLFDTQFDIETVLRELLPILSKARILTYDGKNILHACSGIELKIDFDAMIADYLLHSNRPSSSVKTLFQDVLGTEQVNAACLFDMERELIGGLEKAGLISLYKDMELPLMYILYRMERQGVHIDVSVLSELHEAFTKKLEGLSSQIFELAGERFNILSTKQLAHILFDKLKLPPQRKTKSGYSTDSDVLEALLGMHEIVQPVLDYRFYSKLDSTFVDGLEKCIKKDGKIHTHYQQCVTATGRLSSTDPNLQNIPVKTGEGREIRKAFVPNKGNVLIGADYSQIELRLLAHISGDEGLIRSFQNNEDIHKRTASEVFHVPFEEVSSEQRSAAKAVNFGIIYGISDFGLAKNLGIPVKQAGQYIGRYLDMYPQVKQYMGRAVEKAKDCGYASTIFGRIRPIPELRHSNYNIRSFGERIAMNMPIQGSAADIMKLSMIKVSERMRAERLEARLILQVHDELIVDCPLNEAQTVAKILTECMENAYTLSVPLIAEAKIGSNWYEMK
ncbi:MAG: DNA polymerase I [Clostridia bacterium]|nr:DNA polymerase I [Clostridia bacterium]